MWGDTRLIDNGCLLCAVPSLVGRRVIELVICSVLDIELFSFGIALTQSMTIPFLR